MSRVVEPDQNEKLNEDEEIVELGEAVDSTDELEEQQQETDQEQVREEEPEIPDKFKNKSVEEIVNSYRELEREYGRRNNEIGELRKLTDQLLELEIQQKKNSPSKESQTKEPEVSDDDWFNSPKTATEKYLESSSYGKKVQELESKLQEQEREKAHAKFEERHPNWQKLGQESEFAEFIQSSNYRYNLALQADNGDYDAANELFDVYKLYRDAKGISQQEKEVQQKVDKEKLDKERQKASVESTSSAPRTKKVYRRADLIRLKMEDPQRYEAMQDEIMKAYAEGRVK